MRRGGERIRSRREVCVREHEGVTRTCRDPTAPATRESQGSNLCVLEPAVNPVLGAPETSGWPCSPVNPKIPSLHG